MLSTGVVSGSVTGSDLDGDTLTYSATTDGTKGTVSIDPNTGAWTYTPTYAARHNAAATGAAPGSRPTPSRSRSLTVMAAPTPKPSASI